MAISQKRYVEIISSVGGAPATTARELIARLYTHNELAPFGKILEFSSLDDVGRHFGTESDEYKFSSKYFGFVSKNIQTPKKISFARTTPSALAPHLKSTVNSLISELKSITSGNLTLSINDTEYDITGIDLSSCNTLAEVATAVQGKINDFSEETMFSSAEVAIENSSFTLTLGDSGDCKIDYAKGTVAKPMGFDVSSLPIVSFGADAETLTSALSRTTDISNNFGSMVFLFELNESKVAEIADWVNAQNFLCFASVGVTEDTASSYHSVCDGKDGIVLTLVTANGKEEFMPCAILASIDYSKINATQNFMYQPFEGEIPSVETNEKADVYDGMNINYYGATQQAGKKISFYQRGVMQGSTKDIGVFCNEMWLKDAFAVQIFNLLLALGKVPANRDGEDMVRGVLTNEINTAILNGTISKSKELTATQKAYITNITGVDTAWNDVYNNGYYLTVKAMLDGEEYKIDYMLIYSKGDSIKKVEGTHVLI